MKTREELKIRVEASIYAVQKILEDGVCDEYMRDKLYEIAVQRIFEDCEDYFNFEKEHGSVMPKKAENTPFLARMFDERVNNWICGVLLSIVGIIAVVQILRYIGILNLNF